MKTVIAAGRTGGHIFPGIAIAEAIKDESDILFVGERGAVSLVRREGFRYYELSGVSWKRELLSANTVEVVCSSLVAIGKSLYILMREKPDVVVGTGGYSSLPAVLAAYLLRIPTIVCEQNVRMGLANRILSQIATKVALSYEETERVPRNREAVFTGNPVRKRIGNISRSDGLSYFGFSDEKTILIMGGSQGSSAINRVVLESVKELGSFQLIWLTGDKDYSEIRAKVMDIKSVRVFPFLYEMEMAYSVADLCICRAGATTLAEMAVCGIPAVIIPYPYATDDHQLLNAKRYKNGYVVEERELTKERLLSAIAKMAKRGKAPEPSDSARRMRVLIEETARYGKV
jgi:UDP-N-acetylglucosamine--N-acetylmuramyl-(pentapeptide) pyrophosphoryl-undecaprenol N-acetylglucosamine transferase